MYPLDVKLPDPKIGFAVANTEAEHIELTRLGYEPAYVPAQPASEPATQGDGKTKA